MGSTSQTPDERRFSPAETRKLSMLTGLYSSTLLKEFIIGFRRFFTD